jgi:hypothetical protein
MIPAEARRLYLRALLTVAPDADLMAVTSGADVCHLDQRQLRQLVDVIAHRTGLPLHHDDADADCLSTIDEAVPFLVHESARVRLLGLQHVG